ncbi:prepilin peptidase [Desulforamulus ruminis]|uniref:Peptidase A24A domain protein n=1 Tax=Desulforamulus ruminis (strain ATCC 23193 / DSM 2154 / NCIMB 8452 / DL) TaxID=696281 RepID=F6DTD4_DESRL|nr:A24 family peptidase [Desulforamulus ruminis]AEG58951.1 peptidase A24A domain protein [Desulforamulus ruminis DSM 2154]
MVIVVVLAGALGAILGSLAACLGYRLPRGISPWGRSFCPACKQVLGPVDLIPILGYFFTKRHCRYCKVKISPIYLMPEITLAFLSALLMFLLGPTPLYFLYMVLLTVTAIAAVSDLGTEIIPDSLILSLILFALPFILWTKSIPVWFALLGAITGVAAMLLPGLLTKKYPGGGDIKLTGAIGFYLGPFGVACVVLLAAVTGLIGQGYKGKREFAFAPYLYVGVIGTVFISLSGLIN